MFLGEVLCLAFYYIGVYLEKKGAEKLVETTSGYGRQAATTRYTKISENEPVKPVKQPPNPHPFNQYVMLVPAMCDLTGTTLSGIGLLYIPASIWQMMRGSIIIFTGLLSRFVLKRELQYYNYFGMVVVVAGLTLVGVASMVQSSGGGEGAFQTILGIACVLLGMFVNAVQFVFEETLLQNKNWNQLQVVGWEGIWGFTMCVFVALPITYFIRVDPGPPGSGIGVDGRYENSLDAFVMMWNNKIILLLGILALFSIASYNYFGLSISKYVSSLTRAVLDSLRTILIWAFEVAFYYLTDQQRKPVDDRSGEAWTVYSWVEVGGFIMLLLGTNIYSGNIRLPCFYYPDTTKPTALVKPDSDNNVQQSP